VKFEFTQECPNGRHHSPRDSGGSSARAVAVTALLLSITTCGSDGTGIQGGPDHEPAGFTVLTEHYFNTVSNDDGAGTGVWNSNGGLSIVSDPTAPKSPSSVGEFEYPAGFHAGSAPGSIEFDDLGGATQLYLSFWMKLSANFQGEGSETNKVGFVWINSQPAVFFSNEGSGSGPLLPTIRYQGNGGESREYFRQNAGTHQAMTRGQWRRWEIVLIANSGGQANGVIRWWIDGQKVGEYTDVRFRTAAQPFQYMFLQPIWGGVDGTVTSTQHLWIDHLRISGHS
jgi:hypothetical protein